MWNIRSPHEEWSRDWLCFQYQSYELHGKLIHKYVFLRCIIYILYAVYIKWLYFLKLKFHGETNTVLCIRHSSLFNYCVWFFLIRLLRWNETNSSSCCKGNGRLEKPKDRKHKSTPPGQETDMGYNDMSWKMGKKMKGQVSEILTDNRFLSGAVRQIWRKWKKERDR